MTSAVYGQMSIGRCLDRDYGHMGCENDALDVLDAECSGRKSCEVLVSIQRFWKDTLRSCLKVLAGFVKAEFGCKRGKHQITKFTLKP